MRLLNMNTTTTATRPDAKQERERIVADLAHEVGLRLDTFSQANSRAILMVDLQRQLGMPNRDDLRRAVTRALSTRTHWLNCGGLLVGSRRLQGAAKAS
jgi:hypothetical protein